MKIPLWKFFVEQDDVTYKDHQEVVIPIWLTSFFRNTSLQGVPMVIKQPGFFKKLFWIFAIVFSAFLLQWELTEFFRKFLSWKANTAMTVEAARTLPFPAVTLCNNNPVTTDWVTANLGSGFTNNKTKNTANPSNKQKVKRNSKRMSYARHMEIFLAISGEASKIPYQERSAAGHQLCDMVMGMEYGGAVIEPDLEMTGWHWNSKYGNCFTFNAGLNKHESIEQSSNTWQIKINGKDKDGIYYSRQPGHMYGLYLLLNADSEHYLGHTKQTGWVVVVHNQTEMPFPEESGIFVEPGTSTRIGMSLSYVQRLGHVDNLLYVAPYSDCVNRDDLTIDDKFNAYSKLLEISYTQSACLKTCYQQEVIKTCGCFDFDFPNKGSAFAQLGDVGPCMYDNLTDWDCKESVATKYELRELKCDCPPTCKSYSFETTTSTLSWPSTEPNTLRSICTELYEVIKTRSAGADSTCTSMSYFNTSKKTGGTQLPKVAKNLRNCFMLKYSSKRQSEEEFARYTVGKRFAELFIYYKDFNYQSIIENQSLEVPDLFAYMGGILGLFFGFTILTFFEFVQLFIDFLVIGFGRLCRRKSPKTTPATSISHNRTYTVQETYHAQHPNDGHDIYGHKIDLYGNAFHPSPHGTLANNQPLQAVSSRSGTPVKH